MGNPAAQTDFEKHNRYLENICRELSAGAVQAPISWMLYEKEHSLLTRRETEQVQQRILAVLRENYIYPAAQSGAISHELIRAADLVFRSGFKVLKNSSDGVCYKKASEAFSAIKDDKQHYSRLNLAFCMFVLDVFRGSRDAKADLLERICTLNTNTFLPGQQYLNGFLELMRSLFTKESILDIFINRIFKGRFWNSDLNSKKSCFLWVFPIFWTCFGIEREFKAVYPVWLDIFRKAMQKNMTELVFFMHLHLSHVYMNLAHTQGEFRQFNEEVEKPFSRYILNNVIPEYGIKPCAREKKTDGAKRIGFVFDRIVGSSPVKLLYSLLEKLKKEGSKDEYTVYDYECIEKSPSDQKYIMMITMLGVKYVSAHSLIPDRSTGSYYSRFEKCRIFRERIMNDGIDQLIMCNNREIFNFLFACRTAPEQVYWCHGNFEYDVDGIDRRITHIGTNMQENELEFERFPLKQSDIFFAEEQQALKKRSAEIRKKFPEGAVVFGSIGRLIKLEGEGYLETVAEIMLACPDSVYAACGDGGTDNILPKLKEYGLENRFFFEGRVEPQVYAYVVDVYLSTFPSPSGEAFNEYEKLNNGAGGVALRDLSGGRVHIEEYKAKALEYYRLHKKYGREAVRQIYCINGGNRALNGASVIVKSIRASAAELRGKYPAGAVFIGLNGSIKHADERLKSFLRQLENAVIVYTDNADGELFAPLGERAVHRQFGSVSAYIRGHLYNIYMVHYSAEPQAQLIKLLQACCVPVLLPYVRKFISEADFSFGKAEQHSYEYCFTLMFAGLYDELKEILHLHRDVSATGDIEALFLRNYLRLSEGAEIAEEEFLPGSFMTGKNITVQKLRPLLMLMFKYLERDKTPEGDRRVVGLLRDMMLMEHAAGNLDPTGLDFLIRALIHGGRAEEAAEILARETAAGNIKNEQYILYSALFVLYGDLSEARQFMEKADTDCVLSPLSLLQAAFVKVFLADFESAHAFMGRLYEEDKDIFSNTNLPSLYFLLALVSGGLRYGDAERLRDSFARQDNFYTYREHLWDRIPVAENAFQAHYFTGIYDT
ncbi:hypothetical protein EP073_01320 [Geovibrio thiophilus]|uniref:Glycosyltransferase n=1 Tax=Geovibrio thiophilus TaxID=139438 RepID=A0A3R5XW50_9BACT|nr:hypothetical protein [Geovibrio thiophilus]QAR32088.1 hypothetical protein EP073_01320 [Geovibrio thiophilus]